MTFDPDQEELDLFEARKARAAAEFATVETASVVAYADRVNSDVVRIVERNGFLEKFRQIVQGSAA